MANNDIKLLGTWASPFVNRAVMALVLKAVKHEFIQINPHEKGELLVKHNPVHKKVPVLIHRGRPICESVVIVEYIDDVWTDAPAILPLDPYDRAIARFWAAFIDNELIASFRQIKGAEAAARAEMYEKIDEKLLLLEGAFVECSKGKPFFNGDSVGFLDIILGSFVGWMRVTEMVNKVKLFDGTKIPHLTEWADRLYSDSSVKDVMLDPVSLLDYFNKMAAAHS